MYTVAVLNNVGVRNTTIGQWSYFVLLLFCGVVVFVYLLFCLAYANVSVEAI